MIKKLFVCAATMLIAGPASAYITATYGSDNENPNSRTHIIVVGRGNELSTQFQETAAGKARKIFENYPKDQIYLISVNETGKDSNLDLLRSYGFRNVKEKGGRKLKTEDFFAEMKRFKKIASVDVYTHSVAYYGVILDGKTHRLDTRVTNYASLANNFTDDAYAYLHGCNSGQLIAPLLSKAWGIPVAGSFTSTEFQMSHSLGGLYYEEGRTPKEGQFLSVNNTSFTTNVDCKEGACKRLYPDNFPYNGYWGDFSGGGLGFFKFFCVNNNQETCDRAMAKSAMDSLSVKPISRDSTVEDYMAVVHDIICPQSGNTDIRQKCIEGLATAVREGKTYDSYQGQTLQCDFKGCQAKFTCKRIPSIDLLKDKSCKVVNLRTSNNTTTQVEEYKAYIRGFESLRSR